MSGSSFNSSWSAAKSAACNTVKHAQYTAHWLASVLADQTVRRTKQALVLSVPHSTPFLYWNRLPCMCFFTASRDLSISWPVRAQYSMFLCVCFSVCLMGASQTTQREVVQPFCVSVCASVLACVRMYMSLCVRVKTWRLLACTHKDLCTHFSLEVCGLHDEGLVLLQHVLRIVPLLQLGELAAAVRQRKGGRA